MKAHPVMTRAALPDPDRPLNDQVHQKLCWGLTSGRYKPGQALSIRSLTEEFGTSTMPIREALKRLAGERALEVTPNRAFRVPVLSPGRVAGLFDIRKTLELMATRLAVPRLTKRQIGALAQCEWSMRQAIDQNNASGYFTANHAFHFTLYSAAGNDDLVALIESIWIQIGPSLASTVEAHGFTDEWRLFHNEAVAALQAGDSDAACTAIENDIDWALQHFLRQVADTRGKTKP